jgi:hypothetical protein
VPAFIAVPVGRPNKVELPVVPPVIGGLEFCASRLGVAAVVVLVGVS